jgi:outer membrane protein insertion porin family
VQEALERDVRTLEAFLRAGGHPEATVGPAQVTFHADNSQARVIIPIVEGPRVVLGTISVQGQTVFTERELVAASGLRPGAPWSEAGVTDGQRLLERRYARRGYHGVTVESRSTRRDGVADVEYRIAEGTPTQIGRIIVRGLTRTREEVVRRELRFAPGDPLDPEALADAQRRLVLLGLFERVDVDPLRPPATPYADVTVTVREGRPWYLALGAGYSEYEGVRGFLEAGNENLFGTGQSLALRLRLSELNRRGELLYRAPWLLGSRWTGDASLFYEYREEIGYDLERVGAATGVERELLADRIKGLRTGIRYSAWVVNRFDVEEALRAAEDGVDPGREIIAKITPELKLDRRDRPFDPNRGSVHYTSVELGGVFVGGEANFVKSRLENAWFFSWLPPTVLVLSARFGLAMPLLGDDALPIEERFFAGGATTVRGYRERRLGPLDESGNPLGGNALVILNVEWRFPLWRWLGGAVFVDTAALTPEVRDLALEEFKSGAGAGLRVSTPVGPLRLDAGYPLNHVAHNDRKIRFYISVGYPF